MHAKHIKLLVKKQLKKQYTNWKLLIKKEKRIIARKVTADVIKPYYFNQPIIIPFILNYSFLPSTFLPSTH
jgi:hypothetical protein